MYKKKRNLDILIIGNFCIGTKDPPNGQTQKTRELYTLLKLNHNFKVDRWDTESIRRKKYSNLFLLFIKLIKNRHYIILPAHKSILYVPAITLLFSFFKRSKVIYVVIGGWMPDFIRGHDFLKAILKKLDIILVEAEAMKNNCLDQGITNVDVLPNFKIIEPLNSSKPPERKKEKLQGVFISRIKEEKGVFLLLNALKEIEKKHEHKLTIDFYGPFHDSEEKFMASIKHVPNAKYKGILKPEEVQQVLINYDFFVFPTYYRGEGFSGVFLDAIFSNTPIVASDWKYNSEIIQHNKTGLIFESKNENSLVAALEKIIQNPGILNDLKQNMLHLQEKYYYKNVLKTLQKYLMN